MALPRLNVPKYELIIPSTKEKVKYRPFLVKEEKIFLIALQEKANPSVLFNCIMDMVESCMFNKVDVKNLTLYDLEYIFMQIRIKSKGNIVHLKFKCNNKIKNDKDEEVICGAEQDVEFDLEKITWDDFIAQEKIMLSETIGIIVTQPLLKDISNLTNLSEDKNTNELDTLMNCVKTVFDGDEIYSEYTKEEFSEFIDSFSSEAYAKVKEFLGKSAKPRASINLKCPKCGKEETIELEGLSDFLE